MRVSWKLKYRNFDAGDLRPAFPGAKTWLVGLTDGYHLTRTIYRAANLATISISFCDFKGKDKWKIIGKRLFLDRKSTRLNSSHPSISYAVFCLKKKKIIN